MVSFKDKLHVQLYFQLANLLDRQVSEQLQGQLGSRLEDPLYIQVGEQIDGRVGEQLKQETKKGRGK